jgi:hypothetical protein
MLIGPEKTLGDEQARMNRSTRGQWDWYASHRAAIERLIVPERRGGRICVLGAGNCNDLDLQWLCEAYGEVRLVDIDRAALERAVGQQGVGRRAEIVLDAPVDLTGVAGITRGWRGRRVSEEEVEGAAGTCLTEVSTPAGGGGFDVVLSPCVLSQLMMGMRDLVGRDHPGWTRLRRAIWERHLRTMMGMVGPGGRGVMIVDVTSTSAVPGLDRAGASEWLGLLRMSVSEGKCFRGLEPVELEGGFRRLGARDVRVTAPWLWHLGFAKAFLCYGMVVGA